MQVPEEISLLEETISQHQALIECVTRAYTTLCADGKTLLDTLQMPISSSTNNSLTAKADYTDGASHVLDVVHEVGQVK